MLNVERWIFNVERSARPSSHAPQPRRTSSRATLAQRAYGLRALLACGRQSVSLGLRKPAAAFNGGSLLPRTRATGCAGKSGSTLPQSKVASKTYKLAAPLAFLLAAVFPAAGQERSIGEAAAVAAADLDAALVELRETRETIADEKIPLVRRQRELEAEVAERRRELDRLQRLAGARASDLDALGRETVRREDQHRYFEGLLDEFLRDLEANVPVSEMETFGTLLRRAREAGGADAGPLSLDSRLDAVQAAIGRIADRSGGRSYEGEAVTPDGLVESGRFYELGPVVLFSGPQRAGVAQERIGSLTAHLAEIGRDRERNIREIVETGRGTLPLDVTLGSAFKRAEARTTLWERIRQGGVVMIPILLLAIAALVVALIKWIQIAGMREPDPETLQEILTALEKGDRKKAEAGARSIAGPVGDLLQTAVANARERKELIEEILYEKILRAQPRLERYLPFIALTAATAPLLGLLGTVTGMINTFQVITIFGTGDARTLSGGISEALITTQFGLGVAIVALLIHSMLSRKAKRVIASMEQTEAAFLNGLPPERKHDDD